MTTLSPATLHALHEMWAGRLGVRPSVFEREQTVYRDWPGASAAVMVRAGSTVVIGAPEPALTRLRELSRDQVQQPESLMAALSDLGPQLLGPACLAYADAPTLALGATSQVHRASRHELDLVLALCRGEEREESGLEEMTQWWVATDHDGAPVAATGYETWDERVAHLGVLVAPRNRGTGRGAAAASAAITHALEAGLVPQWRSAVSNEPSLQLGRHLGFVPHGEQITLLLSGGEGLSAR